MSWLTTSSQVARLQIQPSLRNTVWAHSRDQKIATTWLFGHIIRDHYGKYADCFTRKTLTHTMLLDNAGSSVNYSSNLKLYANLQSIFKIFLISRDVNYLCSNVQCR